MTKWKAIYKTGKTLSQYNDKGEEHLFSDINQEELYEFQLITEDDKIISLFLDSGVFGINGFLYKTRMSNKNLNYRLIYFSRKREKLGPRSNGEGVKHFIGYQVTVDENNCKFLVSLKDGVVGFV